MSLRTPLSLGAKLAMFAAAFALCVIVFGAFVRLSNAGLSCPDWPTCYGKATWPGHEHEIASANSAFPERPVETHKAWREQFHRMIAGTLGVLVLGLALLATRRKPAMRNGVLVSAALAAVGTFLYMRGAFNWSACLSALAIAIPLWLAARSSGPAPWRLAVVTLAVIIFQAMLGMWTVTWLLKPVVVMAHLLGGLATFSLLAYIALRLAGVGNDGETRLAAPRRAVIVGLVLLSLQIALGGWTSANYAALACGSDFPTCLGQWWPATDFGEGFVLWRGIGANYEGGVLDLPARSAIQLSHRIGALIVFVYLGWLTHRLVRHGQRAVGIGLGLALLAQVSVGIGNVLLGLPLALATAHNALAVVLLFTLLCALSRTQPRIAQDLR